LIINAVAHAGQWTSAHPDTGGGIILILALLGVVRTVGAGFCGWTMIQTDHGGIKLTPEQERLEPTRPGTA